MVRNSSIARPLLLAIVTAALTYGALAYSDALYKYLGADGEWIYTDRKPEEDQVVEVRILESSSADSEFSVTHQLSGRNVEFVARNAFHSPVEVRLDIVKISGVSFPDPDQILRWVVDPRSDQVLMTLELLAGASEPEVHYRFAYMPGDPTVSHRSDGGYQAPFPVGLDFPITQAYPDSITHQTPDSQYAVDIAMPIGTEVLAARGGVVISVASDNYRGGLDKALDGPAANIIRIMHEDGTFTLYAHLNWNSIRVQPGDYVTTGQYIADSGNTGFSSGPHLHFSVQQNAGLTIESLPFAFRGQNAATVIPTSGNALTAYP